MFGPVVSLQKNCTFYVEYIFYKFDLVKLKKSDQYKLSKSGNFSKNNFHFYLTGSGNLSENFRWIGPKLISRDFNL